jgi:alkylhydroperoxidase/carboxymuconolactone decarboxylase family protein YurZ
MNPETNAFDLFKKEAPEVFEAFNQLVNSLIAMKALDDKTRQLIYLAMKIVTGDRIAAKHHIPMAMKAGASRDEIKETILLTLTVSGLKGLEFLCILEDTPVIQAV